MDKEATLNFGSHAELGSGLWVRTADLDRFRLGEGLRPPSTLISRFSSVRSPHYDAVWCVDVKNVQKVKKNVKNAKKT